MPSLNDMGLDLKHRSAILQIKCYIYLHVFVQMIKSNITTIMLPVISIYVLYINIYVSNVVLNIHVYIDIRIVIACNII